MNQKVFIQKSEEMLNSMSKEELRYCLHNIARKTPENKRKPFIQLLEDSFGRGCQKGSKEKLQYKRLMTDGEVKEKLCEIKKFFTQIENADLCISAQGYEDCSNGYWVCDWIWEYSDHDGIGHMIEDAVIFAHDCMNDCRYAEAVTVFKLAMETQLTAEDEFGGDTIELSLEEIVDEKIVGINLRILALDVLYSNYQSQMPNQRASVLYSYFTYSYFKDISIEDIFSVGREELTDTDEFFQSWIDFLMQQSGEVAARLLKEGLIYYKGTDGLLEMARKGYKEHPSVYLATLLEYEKTHDYEKMKEIGKEALDKLDRDLRVRGEIAMKTAQASCYINDSEFMRKCWYEAFYSNSTILNYLRLFTDTEAIKEYKNIAEKRITELSISDNRYNGRNSEIAKNSIDEIECKHLYFLSGHFDKVKSWCVDPKGSLGWTGNFIGHGANLMLLYLYAGNNLRKAGKEIAARVSNRMGFSESKIFEFVKENPVLGRDVSGQRGEEIFWNIFCLWKENYKISGDDITSYVDWVESVIDNRIDGIVGGKYRSKYNDVALLAAVLGEVKESLDTKMAKRTVVKRYLNRYPRHSAFRRELKKYMD